MRYCFLTGSLSAALCLKFFLVLVEWPILQRRIARSRAPESGSFVRTVLTAFVSSRGFAARSVCTSELSNMAVPSIGTDEMPRGVCVITGGNDQCYFNETMKKAWIKKAATHSNALP